MTIPVHGIRHGLGRPRGFDEAEALEAAMLTFRDHGYAATSLDHLTEAMGISRSSFYAAFGSKHAVLMATLEAYSTHVVAALEAAAPRQDAARAMVAQISDSGSDPRGCLLANMVSELARRDPEVAALGCRHFSRIRTLLERAINPADPEAATDQARAALALALGMLLLRKVGLAPDRAGAALAVAEPLYGTTPA